MPQRVLETFSYASLVTALPLPGLLWLPLYFPSPQTVYSVLYQVTETPEKSLVDAAEDKVSAALSVQPLLPCPVPVLLGPFKEAIRDCPSARMFQIEEGKPWRQPHATAWGGIPAPQIKSARIYTPHSRRPCV